MKTEITLVLSDERFGFSSSDVGMVLEVDLPLPPVPGLLIMDAEGEYHIERVIYDTAGEKIIAYIETERWGDSGGVADRAEELEQRGWKREKFGSSGDELGSDWTRTPPTEPGWYKAIRTGMGEVEFVEVVPWRYDDGMGLAVEVLGTEDPELLTVIELWWSEKERLPAPPKEDGC